MLSRRTWMWTGPIGGVPGVAPTVVAILPASGFAAGGTALVIEVDDSTGCTSAAVGGVNLSGFAIDDPTHVSGTTGAHAAGASDVTVTNASGTSDPLVGAFTYVAAPTVLSITPTDGPESTATAAVIAGTGFVTGCTATINGVSCTSVVFNSSIEIECDTPAGIAAGGPYDVVVTNPDTQFGTLVAGFEFTAAAAAPAVSSVNKTYTRAQGGILLTVTGTDFVSGATVAISGTACTSVVFTSATELKCITPAKAAGAYDVVVTNPDAQTSGASGAGLVEYINPTSIFGANLKRWYSQTYATGAWTDESGNANTSQSDADKRPTATTLAGTTDRPATHVALSFDGAGDALNAGGDDEVFTTAGVVAAIIKTPTISGYAMIVSKLYGGAAYQLGSATEVAADSVAFGVGGTSGTELAVSDAVANDNATHRLIGTFLGHAADPTTKLYVDGALQTDTGTGGTAVTDTADFMCIGAASLSEAGTDYYWTGLVAEVVIADVDPTATQRSKLDAYLRDCAGQAA